MLVRSLVRGLALLALPVLAGAATPESREADLEAIRGEIAGLQNQLARLGGERRGLVDELSRIEIELELQERRIDEAGTAAELTAIVITDTEQRVVELEHRLDRVRASLREGLIRLYQVGGRGQVRLLLEMQSGERMLGGLRQLRYLARRDDATINEFVEAREVLDAERGRLATQQAEVRQWLGKEEQGKRNLEALRGRQQTTIARLDKQRRGVAAESSRLLEKERRLAELLDHLYGRATAPLGGTPIQRFRGVLDWPARGPVEVAFGPRKDPTYQTVVPHNGLQIGTRVATEVRSIFPGKVLFADELEGYGTTIVVHHPGYPSRAKRLLSAIEEMAG